MPITSLRFEVTWTIPYPIATAGTGTALTMCRRMNDPYLAFLSQVPHDDQVLYLTIMGSEVHRHPSPLGHETISGMAYDPFRRLIWCSQSTQDPETIIAFDPNTGLLTGARMAPLSPTMISPQGLACNGFFFVRAGSSTLELWATNGLLLGTHTYTGRIITGVSASPWSYSFVDRDSHEIVVIGPFGNELAVSTGVGAAGGMQALAFDYVTYHEMDDHPQVWLPDGMVGDPGTINHPDTPWDPIPWGGRHRLYVGNETDQIIYAGYLTEY
jgi:hypothetical protein